MVAEKNNSFEKKLHEEYVRIFRVKPNDLGNKYLTNVYKATTSPLKKVAFIYLVPLAFIFAFLLYIIFGQLVIRLVSLLQYGL